MFRILSPIGAGAIALLASAPADASTVYLNFLNMTVEVGPGTGPGSSNNTFDNGFGIEKVIDAPSADAEEFHSQVTHIWYTFSDPTDGLELLFEFDVSYDIDTLHFWNYTGESFDVDQVDFTFFDSVGAEIGSRTILPALGSASGIEAEDIPLLSPLNTRSVRAFLTGTNGEVDFQNIGFSALVSDPDLDPDAEPDTPPNGDATVPLPAAGWLLAAAFAGLIRLRRDRG
jgi:hypothetical protein